MRLHTRDYLGTTGTDTVQSKPKSSKWHIQLKKERQWFHGMIRCYEWLSVSRRNHQCWKVLWNFIVIMIYTEPSAWPIRGCMISAYSHCWKLSVMGLFWVYERIKENSVVWRNTKIKSMNNMIFNTVWTFLIGNFSVQYWLLYDSMYLVFLKTTHLFHVTF